VPLRELLLQDGSIKLLLGIEVPKDDGFVYFRMGSQIPSRGASKAVPGKHVDRRFDNLLPLARFFHK